MVRQYRRLNRTPGDKSVIAQSNGGAPRWMSEETWALRNYRAMGMSWLEIAELLERSKPSVVGKAKRLGMTDWNVN